MTCHFVYSVPLHIDCSLFARINRKLRRILGDCGIPLGLLSNRQPDSSDFKYWPVQSPSENTRNVYTALSKILPTSLYDLTERVHCNFQQEDIFLGHPYFPHVKGRYGVTEMAFKEKIRPKKLALITPLHCDIDIQTDHINKPFLDDVDRMLPQADLLFGIMGEYWWDRWDTSPYAHWKKKMIRLDMAVDSTRYPRVKRRFNRPGKRGYLYIGNSSDPRKGTDFLSQLMGKLPEFPKGWIGSGPDIPNVPRIHSACQLTADIMSQIAEEYDFFISPSKADPNPTTILESMAWGFPVICTPQSGYYGTFFRKIIYLDDLDKSIAVLNELQTLDEYELQVMADRGREAVERDYNWERFTSIIIENLFA